VKRVENVQIYDNYMKSTNEQCDYKPKYSQQPNEKALKQVLASLVLLYENMCYVNKLQQYSAILNLFLQKYSNLFVFLPHLVSNY
jgi:hypothetical protein